MTKMIQKEVFYLEMLEHILQCFDSIYENIIIKLFNNNNIENTHILFYLKCDDAGPKGQAGWNFIYPSVDKEKFRK